MRQPEPSRPAMGRVYPPRGSGPTPPKPNVLVEQLRYSLQARLKHVGTFSDTSPHALYGQLGLAMWAADQGKMWIQQVHAKGPRPKGEACVAIVKETRVEDVAKDLRPQEMAPTRWVCIEE